MFSDDKYPIYNFDTIKQFPYTILLNVAYTEKHSHIFWEMVYCLEGESINTINGKDCNISRGTALIIRPQDVHTNALKRDPYFHRDIYVPVEKMKRICAVFGENFYENLISDPGPILFKLSGLHLDSLERSLRLFQNVAEFDEEHDLIHSAIVSRFIGFYHEALMERDAGTPEWIINLITKINTQAAYLKLQDIISSTGYSHGHVCREFKRYMGISLIRYLTNSKISYSTALLYNKDISILEISLRLGYSNQSNYVNAFKKQYGISPGLWRKQNVQ